LKGLLTILLKRDTITENEIQRRVCDATEFTNTLSEGRKDQKSGSQKGQEQDCLYPGSCG
jgi:hypothetical protein